MVDFQGGVKPDGEAFLKCIRREGTPDRVHFVELFLDWEIQIAVLKRFGLDKDLNPESPEYPMLVHLAVQRFMGYDYVCSHIQGLDFTFVRHRSIDSAEMAHEDGRNWVDESKGPIQNWEDFEKYPWPKIENMRTDELEWYEKNTPDDMIIVARGVAHYDEFLCWLMGYETLCYAMYEQPDLVEAIRQKVHETVVAQTEVFLQCDRVRAIWGSDDMGFKSGLLLGPQATREMILPGHKYVAEKSHEAGRPYLLHSCGNMSEIMEDLIEDVKIDAKHSFEDTIEDVIEVKKQYGDRVTLLGGIDVDFLCRADEAAIRERVRKTIDACQPGGGWMLGSGNSVANYVPVENYLIMMDEGVRYGC
ncbi:MAG: uroporphyrinogen decarboxylase family protein [bacterium]